MLAEYLRVKLRAMAYFRTSLIFEMLASGTFLFVNIVFWNTIFFRTDTVAGLSQGDIYMYLVLIEYFAVIYAFSFSGYSKLWRLVISGELDILLLSPRVPYFYLLCENLRPVVLLRMVPVLALAAFTLSYMEANVSLLAIVFGLVLVAASVFVFSLIQFSSSCLSFWFGRAALVDEIADQLTAIQRVPHSVFSTGVKFAIAIILPLAIGPTQAVLFQQMRDPMMLVNASAVIVGSALLWGGLSYVAWVNGLRRYTSFGG